MLHFFLAYLKYILNLISKIRFNFNKELPIALQFFFFLGSISGKLPNWTEKLLNYISSVQFRDKSELIKLNLKTMKDNYVLDWMNLFLFDDNALFYFLFCTYHGSHHWVKVRLATIDLLVAVFEDHWLAQHLSTVSCQVFTIKQWWKNEDLFCQKRRVGNGPQDLTILYLYYLNLPIGGFS